MEITFNEAIDILRENGTFQVVYKNNKIEYIDKFDDLEGLSFKDFFEATFYKLP